MKESILWAHIWIALYCPGTVFGTLLACPFWLSKTNRVMAAVVEFWPDDEPWYWTNANQ